MTRCTGLPRTVRDRVQARSGGQCEAMLPGCSITATQFHHRRPRAMGGTRRPSSNTAAACLHLCHYCHDQIETQRRWAVDNGFLVAQHHEPTERPVWWRSKRNVHGQPRFVLLDDFGNRFAVAVGRPA